GAAVTRLTQTLDASELVEAHVESTLGFGENTDGAGNAKLLINGEVILASARTSGPTNFRFQNLTRGSGASQVQTHPVGSLVYDIAGNTSALDHVRRGF